MVGLRHVLVLVGGAGLGIASLLIARDHPGGSLAGDSVAANVALLAAGWALIACGVAAWARRPVSRFGPLFTVAGMAWFLVELDNP
jgi:hypothetical protein